MVEFRSDSADQTLAWARALAPGLKGDEVFFLTGELGAGKTLFCKGLAEGMGIDPDEVVSPTFTLQNCFEGPSHYLYHLDLYRIGNGPGTIKYYPEIDDQLGHGVIVVEWAEYLDPSYWALEQLVLVKLDIIGEHSRLISLSGPRSTDFIF